MKKKWGKKEWDMLFESEKAKEELKKTVCLEMVRTRKNEQEIVPYLDDTKLRILARKFFKKTLSWYKKQLMQLNELGNDIEKIKRKHSKISSAIEQLEV